MGFSRLKALLGVNDAEAFQAYIGKHSELVKSVSERFAGDAKAVAELGSDLSTKVQKPGKESVRAVTEKVAWSSNRHCMRKSRLPGRGGGFLFVALFL